MFPLLLTLSVLLCTFDGSKATPTSQHTVYLRELTIFKSHETKIPFISNPPEVYLSCEDGLSSTDIGRVKKTKHLYVFGQGDQPTTRLGSSGCVTCRLKEEDPIVHDQTFGTWEMCEAQFIETGSYYVRIPDEFDALFDCPSCKVIVEDHATPVVAPESIGADGDFQEMVIAPAPDEDVAFGDFEEELVVTKIQENKEEEEETFNAGVYGFEDDDSPDEYLGVSLFSTNEANEEGKEEDGNGTSGSSIGMTTLYVLISVFIFGIMIGVFVVLRYPQSFAKISTIRHGGFCRQVDSRIALTEMKVIKK